MKMITEYQCEICKWRYDTQAQAESCEARGFAPEIPIGCIDGDDL